MEKPAYIISISAESENEVISIIQSGKYSFKSGNEAKALTNRYSILVDFQSMRAGDYLYIFNNRNIYGRCIATEIDVRIAGDTKTVGCVKFKDDPDLPVISAGGKLIGVDMDVTLNTAIDPMRSLRLFSGLSWIKMTPPEAKSLESAFLLQRIGLPAVEHVAIDRNPASEELSICETDLLSGEKISEMLIELAIIGALKSGRIFNTNSWDFIHHQFPSGPMKPIEYLDKIDCICISYIPKTTVPRKVLIIEIKNKKASADDLRQLMKYVDWVAKDMVNGRYDLIEAALIAPEFHRPSARLRTTEAITSDILKKETSRYFAKDIRTYKSEKWECEGILKTYQINRNPYTGINLTTFNPA